MKNLSGIMPTGRKPKTSADIPVCAVPIEKKREWIEVAGALPAEMFVICNCGFRNYVKTVFAFPHIQCPDCGQLYACYGNIKYSAINEAELNVCGEKK